MGILKRVARRVAARVAQRVAKNELFEKPGERASAQPMGPLSAAPAAPAAPAVQAAPAAPAAPAVPSAPARPVSKRPAVGAASEKGRQAPCTAANLDDLKAALGPSDGWRVVNHWASWCIPCVEEFPELLHLSDQLAGRATLLGVSWDLFDPRGDEDDIVEHVENFAVGHGLLWPTLLVGEDVDAEDFFEAFAIRTQTVPQTWVIDPAGTIVLRVEGLLTATQVPQLLACLPDVAV